MNEDDGQGFACGWRLTSWMAPKWVGRDEGAHPERRGALVIDSPDVRRKWPLPGVSRD